MSSSSALIDPTLSSESINNADLPHDDFATNGEEIALIDPSIESILIDADELDADVTPRFADLDLPKQLLRAAADLRFDTPTAIQAAAIPALLDGRDITGVAQTGTGKTAAFGMPLLASINGVRGVQALVLTPPRELAVRVAEAIASFAAHLPAITVVPIYGGASFLPQRAALKAGA